MKLLLSFLQTSRSSSLDDGKMVFFLATKNQTSIRQLYLDEECLPGLADSSE